MDQGCPQAGGAAQGCRDTRNHLDLHIGIILRCLVDQSRHAVDTRVAAADKGDIRARLRLLQGKDAPLLLPAHGGGDDFFVRKPVFHQIHIDMVSGDHVAVFYRMIGLEGHLVNRTGSYNDHSDFSFFAN